MEFRSKNKTFNLEDFNKKNENIHLSLRKNKLESFINSKRICEINNFKYEINPQNVFIDNSLKFNINELFKNFDINLLKNYFFSDNINLNKYALYIFRKYLSNGQINLDNFFDNFPNEIFNKIFSYVSYINHKDICFETSWILINISYYNSNFFDNKNIQNELLIFLKNFKSNDLMLINILEIIRNISNDLKLEFLIEKGIFQIFYEIFDNFRLNDTIAKNILTCIYNMCKIEFYNKFTNEYLNLIEILKFFLNVNNNNNILRYSLYVFFNLSKNSNKIIDEMIKFQIPQKLMNLYNFLENEKFNLRLFIIKIFGNFFASDDITIKILIEMNVIDFLNECLKTTDLILLKNIIFCFSNIALGTFGLINEIFNKNSIYLILQLGIWIFEEINKNNNNNKNFVDVYREICYVIANCINGSISSKLNNMLNYKNNTAIFLLINSLDILKENENFIYCALNAINKLSVIEKFDNLDSESYLIEMENFGLKEKLENLTLSNNINIANNSEIIYDNFFNNNL